MLKNKFRVLFLFFLLFQVVTLLSCDFWDNPLSGTIGASDGISNKMTFGLGMIFLHELHHTGPMGSKRDGWSNHGTSPIFQSGIGPTVRSVNIIRRQMGYQTRRSYNPYDIEGSTIQGYIPFDKTSEKSLRKGNVPLSNSAYIQVKL